MARMFQFLPKMADRWVRGEAGMLAAALRDWGWDIAPADEPASAMTTDADDLIVVHLTRDLTDEALPALRGRLVVILHSAVEESDLNLCEKPHAGRFRAARALAAALVPRAELCVAHCAAGADLLAKLGAQRVRTVPLLFDPSFMSVPPDPFSRAFAVDGHRCLLSVGDLLPQSGGTDALRSWWYFDSFENRPGGNWRLLLAGRNDVCDGCALDFADALAAHHIPPQKFLIDGNLSDAQLRSWYEAAEAYLHFDAADLSGGALLAAMHHGLPIVGAAVGAATELLGEAAPLSDRIIHSAAAENLAYATADPAWRARIIAAQNERLHLLRPETILFTWRSFFSRFE